MADDIEEDIEDISEGESDVGDGAPAKKKLAGKTLILFIVHPALIVLGGGGGAAMMLMGGGKADASTSLDSHASASLDSNAADTHAPAQDSHGSDESQGSSASSSHGESTIHSSSELDDNGAVVQIGAPGEPSFYTMPKIIVTVNSGNGRRSQLLVKLTLESDDPMIFDRIDSVLPRITDQFQMFLREMRIDDLSGSAGDYRIRRELRRRVNMSLYPDSIDAVLIEEFIVQ